MIALLGLFTGPLGKFLIYGLLIGGVVLGAWGYLHEKENAAAAAALVKYNQAQLAATEKENAAAKAQLAEVLSHESALQTQLKAANAMVDSKTKEVQGWIDSLPKDSFGKTVCGFNPIYNELLQKENSK